MAEGNEETSGGSWWGSWLNSAKAKTSTVLEAVKKDLDELSTAVRTEASNVGAALESTLKFDDETSPVESVKKSLSSFFGQVSEALVPSMEDDEVEAVLITREGAVTLTGFPKHLADLQGNEKTYTCEPVEELAGKYKRWMEVVEQDQFTQNQLNKHLASSEILNEKYLGLVPEKVPHMEFWKRYLFKRALLQDAIANADLAERRAKVEVDSEKSVSPNKVIIQTEQPKLACNEQDLPVNPVIEDIENEKNNLDQDLLNEELNWEGEKIPCNIEISEEEQIRLLEEYEQEIQEREKKKSTPLIEDSSSQIEAAKVSNKAQSLKKSEQSTEKKSMKQTSSDVKKNSKSTTNNKLSPKNNDKQQDKKTTSPVVKDRVLKVQKDHFNKEENSSSTSDESWEKDFDLDE